MLKHSFVSTQAQSADPNVVSKNEWNADHVVDKDGITLATGTPDPSNPVAGKVVLFAKDYLSGAIDLFARNSSGVNQHILSSSSTYVGKAGLFARVVAGENGIEFVAPPSGGSGGVDTFAYSYYGGL